MITILDLFSGIGAFSLGLERTGAFKTIAFCETDPFCRRVLARHWPEVPILGDISAITEFPAADIIVGGFPCQDVSRAGKRVGVSGARSGLYRELVRAVRMVRPKHAILENVAALLGDGMGDVLGDLAEGGDCVEWDCVPAEALGAPHERDRVWIVAHADGERRLQREGGQQNVGGRPDNGRLQEEQLADPARIGCGPRRQGRPPDSFARVRDATRWHAANAHSARFKGRQQSEAARVAFPVVACCNSNPWWPWTDEPEISGVDDGAAYWVDRTKATGNTLIPLIPQLIGHALMEAGL
jgi:DNA (cytosine-5)-methyltransferase 1